MNEIRDENYRAILNKCTRLVKLYKDINDYKHSITTLTGVA